ncbi:MAG TPA: tRNA 2-thiouridine(34) synthase MnmA [Dokdonella sp.]|uniref:tRNA 2-thiouridine(34) synthase MnmA n=1 Tax=Dokdonella sp. TaxID=2291710 RepID=UPI0025BD5FD4|nr:tRNA 2-thiouridine(34) synthase MnmA [Dokdonella sp.]MBX3692563.1 tRNA 2-thiouridine(34) synthase MnmA [Dokdonella sp.]MCW5568572.1 tRNA 2-thiouridine(34) synthase MnmA [Dokdonella sp.]HNR92359.1 tRNA 2-thiouridine(34) synthase MnmA [Dokdonella sp.]
MNPPRKIVVGMSGGVDSSVAALLLVRAGEQPAGMFMQNWEEDERLGPCRAEQDRKDAVAVCARLGMPIHMRNFAAEYWDQVFSHFLAEYRAGRTPNPDVLCNREIKFKTFLEHARALGAERIATGHYARIDSVDGRWRLLRGRDAGKDQSYFLHALGQEALAATLFPIGELEKSEVRRLALDAGLPTHAKKDSTGICFIGERDLREFLGHYIPARRGEIRTPDGQVVGEHAGVWYYTLGQRGGLGIGGRSDSSGEPWYVVGKDVARNILYAVQGNANEWLLSRHLLARSATWIDGGPPATEFACTAKTRYRQPDQACRVAVVGDTLHVAFDEPQRAVTPGQSVVFYDGDACLGGGVIECSDAPLGGWK